MQENYLYEYAIIRIVPQVQRGECINIGVVLYCKSLRFLDFKYQINQDRILAIFPKFDIDEVTKHAESFSKICIGTSDSGLIGNQDLASRFRWLTARRSTIIQASEVHPGYCSNPSLELEKIFEQMVIV